MGGLSQRKQSLTGRGDSGPSRMRTTVRICWSFGRREICIAKSFEGRGRGLQTNDSTALVAETHTGQPKVSELDVSICADEHVVGFEVSMNDAMRVEVLYCKDQLCYVHQSHFGGNGSEAVQ